MKDTKVKTQVEETETEVKEETAVEVVEEKKTKPSFKEKMASVKANLKKAAPKIGLIAGLVGSFVMGIAIGGVIPESPVAEDEIPDEDKADDTLTQEVNDTWDEPEKTDEV